MDGGADDARGIVIAIDLQFGQPSLDIANRLIIIADALPGFFVPDTLGEQIEFDPQAADQIAGIASAGAEAAEFLFQHDHLGAARRQLQRRGQPGKARADDDDIGGDMALKRGLQVIRLIQPSADGAKRQRSVAVTGLGLSAVHGRRSSLGRK